MVFATNFCAMGSLSDIHNFGDWRRFRAWMLAGATALVGAQLLQAAGVVALDKSMYLAAPASTGPATSLGGLMFGFGMVFTGGCPSRNLARAGGGDLRSLLTLVVLGLFAYMAIARHLRAGAGRARAGDQLSLGRADPEHRRPPERAAGLARLDRQSARHDGCSLPRPRLPTASPTRASAPRRCTSSPEWPSA